MRFEMKFIVDWKSTKTFIFVVINTNACACQCAMWMHILFSNTREKTKNDEASTRYGLHSCCLLACAHSFTFNFSTEETDFLFSFLFLFHRAIQKRLKTFTKQNKSFYRHIWIDKNANMSNFFDHFNSFLDLCIS